MKFERLDVMDREINLLAIYYFCKNIEGNAEGSAELNESNAEDW